VEASNTGTPLAQSGASRKTIKEISAVADFCTGIKSAKVKAA